jgi:hypothetical protein
MTWPRAGFRSPCARSAGSTGLAGPRAGDTFGRMKLARPALLVVLVLVVRFGLAHAIELGAVTIRNSGGSSIGRVDADGTLRDDSGSAIGRIDRDGTVRGSSGGSIGRIDGDGTVRGRSGSSIGRVDADGQIRGGGGSAVGRIDGDGTIRNASGSSVGRVDGYSPGLRHMVAAVLFFGGSVSVLKL